jgi:hypothetical protein
MSDGFKVIAGLRKRDVLSMEFFNIALVTVVKKTQSKNSKLKKYLENKRKYYEILAYTDNIVILNSVGQKVKMDTKELIINSKNTGIQINESKTKYMVISKRESHEDQLEIENYKFEKIHSFTNLDVTINGKYSCNNHQEIIIRTTIANK